MLWLNGPFGVGKTSVALKLRARLPHSFILDPEELGFALRKLTPPQKQLEDFQDYPLWREMVLKTLLHAYEPDTTLIVSMTLVDPGYFEEVVSGLRAEGLPMNHVVLTASKETILQRLESRGHDRRSWPAEQLERCLAGLELLPHTERLNTEGLAVSEVAKRVAARFDLEVKKDFERPF